MSSTIGALSRSISSLTFAPAKPPPKPKRPVDNPPSPPKHRDRTASIQFRKSEILESKPRTTTVVSMKLSSLTLSSMRKKEIVEVWFHLPVLDHKITLQVPSQNNSLEVKKQLIQNALSYINGLESKPPKLDLKFKEDHYTLSVVGIDYFLVNESLPLQRDKIIQLCNKAYVTPKLEMIKRESLNTSAAFDHTKGEGKKKLLSEITLNTDIATLLDGELLSTYLNYENPEISSFRRDINMFRIDLLQDQGFQTNVYPEYVHNEPLPMNVPSKVVLLCYFPNGNGTTQLAVKPFDTAEEVTVMVFKRYEKMIADREEGKTERDYILKVTGKEEYVRGPTKIIDFDFIRKGLSINSILEVSLLLRGTLYLSSPEALQSLNIEESLVDQMMMVESVYEEEDDTRPSKEIIEQDQPLRIYLFSVEGLDGDLLKSSTSSFPFSGSTSSTSVFTPLTLDLAAPPLRYSSSGTSTGNSLMSTLNLPKDLNDGSGHGQNGSQTERARFSTSRESAHSALVYVTFEVYHAGLSLFPPFSSQVRSVPSSGSVLWKEWIPLCPLRSLPRGARVCMTLFKKGNETGSQLTSKDIPIAWVTHQIVDHRAYLRDSVDLIGMWTGDKVNPLATPLQNLSNKTKPSLRIGYETYDYSIKFSDIPATFGLEEQARIKESTIEPIYFLDAIIAQDSLAEPTPEEKKTLWDGRYYCSQRPAALSKFLSSVTWNDTYQVREAYKLIQIWVKPSPTQAMELLDSRYPDPYVRNYAVEILDTMADCDILDLMLQLTQVLKHEGNHDSALSRFLLKRALANKKIGHAFFWHLKSELHLPQIAERYILLLEAFLRGCNMWTRKDLIRQDDLINKLNAAAERIKKTSAHEKRSQLSADLKKINFSEPYTLPLDQRMVVSGIVSEKSKTMDSKKQPLWLVFQNAEVVAKPITVIFKSGDDLRQDVLTLQMLRLMDKVWKKEGLDFRMHPYGCIATGNEVGMIEVVLNADTTANINKQYGGPKAVLYKDTLSRWLHKYNPSTAEFDKARENFYYSCAGYCVATYVLGIGDRHNDNIMLTKAGHLFHIDFGHFLGNFKKKLGFRRERAPFVFNPQYADIFGGPKTELFREFVDICCRAYNILRTHSQMFINLFQMMLCTGITELQSVEDIEYLRKAFSLGKSEEEAAKHFADNIHISLNTKTTIINDVIHVIAHSK
eukprot:TRINITY_DN3788_c0_g1_i1.p1 TRINITY_DN3788_c0_g1~~TRINITY_DN3788_c0_g1_i1.p1  ORF type:complete len:1188 (-),score=230.45 TRINITY_DN3788_c0_g1_i1:129-3692(-)